MFGFRLAEIPWHNNNHRNYHPQYVNIIKKFYPLAQEPQNAPIPVSLFDSWEITNTADYEERHSFLWVKCKECSPTDAKPPQDENSDLQPQYDDSYIQPHVDPTQQTEYERKSHQSHAHLQRRNNPLPHLYSLST